MSSRRLLFTAWFCLKIYFVYFCIPSTYVPRILVVLNFLRNINIDSQHKQLVIAPQEKLSSPCSLNSEAATSLFISLVSSNEYTIGMKFSFVFEKRTTCSSNDTNNSKLQSKFSSVRNTVRNIALCTFQSTQLTNSSYVETWPIFFYFANYTLERVTWQSRQWILTAIEKFK